MRLSELAETLYGVRCAREALGPRGNAIARDRLRSLDVDLCTRLRNAGHDPGETALEVDELKLRMIAAGENGERTRDEIARCIEHVGEIDGSAGFPHRTVARWAEFVSRAMLAGVAIPDDTDLPVRPWVKARDLDTSDMTVMAEAFVEWTREVMAIFEKRRV